MTYAAQVVTGLVGLLLVPFLIVRLGEEQFGVIGVTNAILDLAVLVEFGTRPAAARQFTNFLAQGDVRRSNEVASSAFAAYAGIALLIAVIVAAAGPLLLTAFSVSSALRREAWALLLFAALAVGATLLRSVYESALWAKLRYDIPQYAQIFSVLVRGAMVVAIFELWRPELVIWSLSSLVTVLLAMWILRRQAYRQCPTLQLSARLVTARGLRDLAGFSVYTSTLRLSEWLWLSSTPLLISFFLGTAAVAHFAPAMAVVGAFQPLSRAFLVQLTPLVTMTHTAGDAARLARVLLESTRYTLLTNGAASVLIGSLAGPLCRVWLGEGFEDTAEVLVLLCVRELLYACVGGSFPIFVGTGRLRAVTLVGFAAAVAAVALSAWLIGAGGLGVVGVAVSILITQSVRTAFDYYRATSLCGVGHVRYLRESVLGPALGLGVAGAASLALQELIDAAPLVELISAGAVAGLAFAACAWTVGLSAVDRERLLAFVRALLSRGRAEDRSR